MRQRFVASLQSKSASLGGCQIGGNLHCRLKLQCAACRARSTSKYSFGDDETELGEYAWFADNTWIENYPHQVGLKKPNRWGLYDMHGNVWEWCRDVYLQELPAGRDPEITKGSSYRVIRGGSRSFDAARCRSGFRLRDSPSEAKLEMGFRVALTAVVQVKADAPTKTDK